MRYATVTVALVAALALVGCATLSPDADPILVRAEQALEVSFETVDFALLVEYRHREMIAGVLPQAEEMADHLRRVAPDAFRGLDNAITVYRDNRTPDNQATVLTWLAVVESIMRDAQMILAAWGGVS